MKTKIFVNLPVKNLKTSTDFFGQPGFSFDAQFTDDTAACMKIADNILAMLVTESKFREFISNEIADTSKVTETFTCITFENREKVNEITQQAINAGAEEAREPKDYGFLFSRSFKDLDGHVWDALWIAPSFVQREQKVKEKELAF